MHPARELYLDSQREYGRQGGLASAESMTPAARKWRAREGARASRSPMAHARALAKVFDRLPQEEQEAVWAELLRLRQWAHIRYWPGR